MMAVDLANLSRPEHKRIAIRVIPAAERAIREGHPWLFESSIRSQSLEGRAGDVAVVFDRKGRFLAVGLYDPDSPIRVRVLQAISTAAVGPDLFHAKLESATRRRAPLLETETDGYRLAHGENDGLPGLVIDRYGDTLVLKLYTAAWIPHLKNVVDALGQVLPSKRLVLRLSRGIQEAQSPGDLHDGLILSGPPLTEALVFRENGLRFEADPLRGQKTGFFLDQRDNRSNLETLARGRTVLNVFAYTGGFSLYAARGGAAAVTSVDLSEPALAAADRNFALNADQPAFAPARHHTICGDAFQTLSDLRRTRQRYDMVILDPPSFAKRATEAAGALAAYARLTRLGLGVLRPGGVLVQASCSSRVDAESFFDSIHQAATQSRRTLHEIARTGHPLDHPIGFPEGAYLKCLFAMVTRK